MVGEIESNKDSLEIMLPLMEKINDGFKVMHFDNKGDSVVIIAQEKHDKSKRMIYFHEDEVDLSKYTISSVIPLQLYLCGDINFSFLYLVEKYLQDTIASFVI